MLQTLGCDDAQGFFMSPPLSAQALALWIRANDGNVSGLTGSYQAAGAASD